MDPQGASRDDLDVRLDWPGEEPDGAVAAGRRRASNNARKVPKDSLQDALGTAPISGSSRSPGELEFETLRATVALMSARLDALAGALEGARSANGTPSVGIEQLEHSIIGFMKSSTEATERTTETLADIGETVAELAAEHGAQLARVTEALEALRRRIPLRGRSEEWSSDEMIELIAAAVAERLSAGSGVGDQDLSPSRRRRRGP